MKIEHEWYAVLRAPEFRLQAALHSLSADGPYALTEKQGAKIRVVECNRAARKQHVLPGLTTVQALVRCRKLSFVQSTPEQEASAQQALVEMADRLTPFVESTGPGIVTLALPPERSWNEKDLAMRLVHPLESMGWKVQIGMAHNPEIALLAARFARSPPFVKQVACPARFLAPLPIEELQPSAECLEVLRSWGIRTIEQLTALPQAEVCERLGPEVVDLWEQAFGNRSRAMNWLHARERFTEEIDLEQPVEMLEPLLFLIRRFLEQLVIRLSRHYLVPGQLTLELRFEQGAPYTRTFVIPEPTTEVSVLFRMIHTHLDGFTSNWPVVNLQLTAEPTRPNSTQSDLFEQGLRDPHRFAETMARLQAILGAERVGQAQLEPSHHPDAFKIRPYRTTHGDSRSTIPSYADTEKAGLPWLRFRPAIPVHVDLNETLHPVFIKSERYYGPVREIQGPWTLSGNWWETSTAWTRQEWDILMDCGMYRLVQHREQWMLDGQFI